MGWAGQALIIAYVDSKITVDLISRSKMELGHAGILMIDDSGLTKYYEYGRYDRANRGVIRQVSIPNARFGADGKLVPESLVPILKRLSSRSGQGGRIRAAYLVGVDFAQMQRFVQESMREWPDYDWYSNNCTTFADKVARAGEPPAAPLGTVITIPENLVVDYIFQGAGEVRYDPKGEKLCFKEPRPWWIALFNPVCKKDSP